jgi:hypothetical protein
VERLEFPKENEREWKSFSFYSAPGSSSITGRLRDKRGKQCQEWNATPVQQIILTAEPALLNREIRSDEVTPDSTIWTDETYAKATFKGGEALVFEDHSLAQEPLAIRVQLRVVNVDEFSLS